MTTTNPLITEARRLRANCNLEDLTIEIAENFEAPSPESSFIAFAANNIIAFADKIEELQSALDDANGQLGEFFNTPSGAIIKARDEEIAQLRANIDRILACHEEATGRCFDCRRLLNVTPTLAHTELETLRRQNADLKAACKVAFNWFEKLRTSSSVYDRYDVHEQLRKALEASK